MVAHDPFRARRSPPPERAEHGVTYDSGVYVADDDRRLRLPLYDLPDATIAWADDRAVRPGDGLVLVDDGRGEVRTARVEAIEGSETDESLVVVAVVDETPEEARERLRALSTTETPPETPAGTETPEEPAESSSPGDAADPIATQEGPMPNEDVVDGAPVTTDPDEPTVEPVEPLAGAQTVPENAEDVEAWIREPDDESGRAARAAAAWARETEREKPRKTVRSAVARFLPDVADDDD